MSKPIVGISGSHMIDGSGPFPGYRRSYVNDDYVQSVLRAGATPFILPFVNDGEEAFNMIQAVDGLILSGGHDLYPLLYDEEPIRALGDVWPERDEFDIALAQAAEAKGIPIMGICRGHQVLNVMHGGTLYQDLSEIPDSYIKHSQGQTPGLATHTIEIEPNSILFSIVGDSLWCTNSHHHQTVKTVGKGFRVTARAKDGVIEAMESERYPYMVTYQFHPEMMSSTSEEAQALFNHFVDAVKAVKGNDGTEE